MTTVATNLNHLIIITSLVKAVKINAPVRTVATDVNHLIITNSLVKTVDATTIHMFTHIYVYEQLELHIPCSRRGEGKLFLEYC